MVQAQTTSTCQVIDLGLVDYREAYQIQQRYVEQVLEENRQAILLCEHPPVLTLGRMSHESNILWPKDELTRRGIIIESIDRGGDITLHCPGQLVVYPILNLANFGKDLHKYLHQLEQGGIELLNDFDIVANRFSRRTGVWVGSKKLSSIGIGVRKWVSYHGIGINVNTDLELFSIIRPCGLDVAMTSITDIKGKIIDMQEVKHFVINNFCKIFNLSLI